MRICYVVSRWGEPTQTFVRREASAAVAAGHDVTVLTLKGPAASDWPHPVHHLSVTAIVVGVMTTALRHPWRCTAAMWRGVVQGRPRTVLSNLAASAIGLAANRRVPPVDWIHAHFNWVAGTAADALATVRAQPFSIFPHAFDLFDDRFTDRYAGAKLRRAAIVLVESPRIAAETNESFGCHALVQRMGVPPAMVVPTLAPRSGSLILSVGSLLPKKGHDDLIRAVATIDGAELRFLGEGPQRPQLEALASELGVEDRVELCGAVPASDVAAHLDNATLFCLASKATRAGDRDGVPNVLIEAMARGLPVVSTRVSGIPDLLGDGRGKLVDPDDVKALAAAIALLLRDPDAATAQAERALHHVRECYTTDVNWRVLEGRIRQALEWA